MLKLKSSKSFQMIDFKLVAAFISWTATTFVAHYSVKRILVAATPGGAEVGLGVGDVHFS